VSSCVTVNIFFFKFADCSTKRNVNIARGRDTKQSSAAFLPAAGRLLSSSLAVDGNKDSDIYHGSCMSTNESDSDSWIAVDLGKPSIVTGMSLTNVMFTCSKYKSNACLLPHITKYLNEFQPFKRLHIS
jgi:hypothetical protein